MIGRSAVIKGRQVDSNLLAKLEAVTGGPHDPGVLSQFNVCSYLYIKGAIPRFLIDRARLSVMSALADVGEIDGPPFRGLASGTSKRHEVEDPGSFWKRLTESSCIRTISRSRHIGRWVEALLGGPCIPHDYAYLRARANGRGTRLHCDRTFFSRGTTVLTTWIPLGTILPSDGALYLLKASVDSADAGRQANFLTSGEIASDPIRFARRKNVKFLTADFRPGDLVIFDMALPHGSFDNISPNSRVRLSLDVRHQLRTSPRDPRFFGGNPSGIGGGGYQEMLSALPMNRQKTD
jgi:Phytanoyl-CoA dioxygenase (PhyH)